MSYETVLKDNETLVDFDASGEELLILRHAGADVVLFLLYPDGVGSLLLRTFTQSGNQRWKAPKGTRLRLQTTQEGAMAWVGKVYSDSAGDLL